MLFCDGCGKEYTPTFMKRRAVQESSYILESGNTTELEKTGIVDLFFRN